MQKQALPNICKSRHFQIVLDILCFNLTTMVMGISYISRGQRNWVKTRCCIIHSFGTGLCLDWLISGKPLVTEKERLSTSFRGIARYLKCTTEDTTTFKTDFINLFIFNCLTSNINFFIFNCFTSKINLVNFNRLTSNFCFLKNIFFASRSEQLFI